VAVRITNPDPERLSAPDLLWIEFRRNVAGIVVSRLVRLHRAPQRPNETGARERDQKRLELAKDDRERKRHEHEERKCNRERNFQAKLPSRRASGTEYNRLSALGRNSAMQVVEKPA